jgi:hypothetical protein
MVNLYPNRNIDVNNCHNYNVKQRVTIRYNGKKEKKVKYPLRASISASSLLAPVSSLLAPTHPKPLLLGLVPAAATEKTTPNGGVAEEEQDPVTHPAKSYVAVAAENPAPNGGIAKEEGEGAAGTHATARSYAAVAAQAEIEDLCASKLDHEGKLAEAQRENESLAKEAHHMEGVFAQTQEEVTIADFAAASAEKEAASLRAEVERLQATLKIEQGEHELDKRRHEEVSKELEASTSAICQLMAGNSLYISVASPELHTNFLRFIKFSLLC